jgi:2-oxoglutarate dehydrogenase complex dehydrogenase (E1) component-like enzyme
VHIITNNQVGFTTSNQDGRSFQNSSDIVKCFDIPVLRVNCSDPLTTIDNLIRASKFIIKYWKTYKKDILIDMVGYRKHGHNEVDEPSFTQPEMYNAIRNMK